MKLAKGSTMPDFSFVTPFATGRTLYETMDGHPTFLVFLRYYGCTLCQLDIHQLADRAADFEKKGAKLLVVLQSQPELIREQLKEGDLPYEIVCDPDQVLYRQFEIEAAKNKLGMAIKSPFATMKKLKEAQKSYQHGAYEGNEFQLPACFLVGGDGTVRYAHYASYVADLPTPDEMLNLL